MGGINNRILCNITLRSGQNTYATNQARSTYLKINDILNARSGLPNIDKICEVCQHIDSELSAYISNMCPSFEKKETLFDPNTPQFSHLFDNLGSPDLRKKIRILLYPGDRSEIDGLKIPEATHNMILQFDDTGASFVVTEPHKNPPSFFQLSKSEDDAILYIEGLLLDACMCHYLAISDAAYHHEDKKMISNEKVQFILEIVNNNNLNFLTNPAKQLVRYVAKKLQPDTPYISFLSIFTVAAQDVFMNKVNISSYFEDYCNLWEAFQHWYFEKSKRVFSKNNYSNIVNRLLEKNVYQGQISPSDIEREMIECINEHSNATRDKRLGWHNLYALVILKHLPRNADSKAIFESFFPDKLHQSAFCIKRWGDVIHRDEMLTKLKLLPFIVIE